MSYKSALGLPYDATVTDARKAYVALAQTLHPDKGGEPKRWVLLTAAWNAIKQDRLYGKAEMLWQADWDELNGKPKAAKPKDEQPKDAKPGACGHYTKSGPCVRPMFHPTNHMSDKVYQQKKANAKARRQAAQS